MLMLLHMWLRYPNEKIVLFLVGWHVTECKNDSVNDDAEHDLGLPKRPGTNPNSRQEGKRRMVR